MWDKQGVLRGKCFCGDCLEFMTGPGIRCEYCNCVPTAHKKINGGELGKDYSKHTYHKFPVPPVIYSRRTEFSADAIPAKFGFEIIQCGALSSQFQNVPFIKTHTGNASSDSSDFLEEESTSYTYPIKQGDTVYKSEKTGIQSLVNSSETKEECTKVVNATSCSDIKSESSSDVSCHRTNDLVIPDNIKESCLEKPAKTLLCVFCLKTFKFESSRNRHLKTHHRDLVFVCSICKKVFTEKSDFSKHLNQKHPTLHSVSPCAGDLSCELGKRVSNVLPIIDENDTIPPEQSNLEATLSDGYSFKKDGIPRDDQVNTDAIQEQMSCRETGGLANQVLNNSQAVTKQERPKKQQIKHSRECNKTKLIFNIDTEADNVLCKKGPKNISKSSKAELNKIKVHGCDYCDEKFMTKMAKRQHERIKHSPTEFHCQYCGKIYRRLYDLLDHERAHTGQRPFKCNQCDKAFTSQHNLRTHQNRHATKGAFICMYCGKEFDSKSGLEYHELAHTGARPLECNVCGKTFGHRSILATHKRIHTGEKPYKCGHCSKSFRDNSTWRKHVRIHRLQKAYQCRECDKAYNQRWCLRAHYVKSHPGLVMPDIKYSKVD